MYAEPTARPLSRIEDRTLAVMAMAFIGLAISAMWIEGLNLLHAESTIQSNNAIECSTCDSIVRR